MSKVTYESIFTFINASHAWLNAKDADGKDKGNSKTKLGYAIQRVRPRAEKLWNKYQNLAEDIAIDNCSVDEKGIIQKDARDQYVFTKEGLKARNRQRQELFESIVEIESYFATTLPNDLTIAEQLAFEGFVLKEVVGEDVALSATVAH